MKPKHVLLCGKITAVIAAGLLIYYVVQPFGSADALRSFVVGASIVFTCYMLIPFGFVWVGMKLHQRKHNCGYQPTNLERVS